MNEKEKWNENEWNEWKGKSGHLKPEQLVVLPFPFSVLWDDA